MSNDSPNRALESDAQYRYRTAAMEQADGFMKRMADFPVCECMEPMENLQDAFDAAHVRVAFNQKPHVLGLPRLFFLRRGLIHAITSAAREMNKLGWMLRIEDAYRTSTMQRHLSMDLSLFETVYRLTVPNDREKKPPVDVLYRRLGALVANSPKVGTHMSGSALDISVLTLDGQCEIDRGGPYLDISYRTPMDTPFIDESARKNRDEISSIMKRHGFWAYPWEFWHYSSGDAYAHGLEKLHTPARYGPVHMDLNTGAVTPIENAKAPLIRPQDIKTMIKKISARTHT